MADESPAPTESGRSAREPCRVVAFTGPKEGVGKSTIALNLALAWAGSQNRKVIIVQMDPLCRTDLGFLLGVQPPIPTLWSMLSLAGESATGGIGKLLRGRIPITQYGVGVLPLATKREEFKSLSSQSIVKILSALSESYDLFLDVDPYFPMQVFSFDLADIIYWVSLPQRAHFEATYNLFTEFKTLHFAMEKFEIIVNQCNLPGAIAPKEVDRFFGVMQKKVLSYLPWEDLLPEYANTQRILVVENLQSDWVKGLRTLLGRTLEVKPTLKHWDTNVTSEELTEGADLLWKPSAKPAAEKSSEKKSAATPVGGPEPEGWDELKMKMHKLVVAAMETERIRISDDPKQNDENRTRVGAIIDTLLQREPNLVLSRQQREQFSTELVDEILGLGPLQVLLRDPGINEIMVNAFDKVYIEEKGNLKLLPMRFRNNDQVVQVIKRIVAPVGRRIDESVPLVDARLKDGSRVNAIIAPLAVSGPTLTIRRFSAKPFTGEQLMSFGAIVPDMLNFIRDAVIVRKNIIVSGGTGTGKTTFLNMCSNYIPQGERIITVEDTAELNLMAEHWIRLESRPPNIEGKGEVTIRDLIKNCLRMRPDRIIVGECRGGEALDMLQAMNTGHEGSLATIHANTPKDGLSRLSAMCLMAGTDLPISVLVDMISSAVHLFVQLTRFSDGKRRVTFITEITGKDGVMFKMQDLFLFHLRTVTAEGKTMGDFEACGNVPTFYPEFKHKGIEMPLALFATAEQKKTGVVPKGPGLEGHTSSR